MKLVNPLGRVAEADAKLSGIAPYGTCAATCHYSEINMQATLEIAKARA